MQITTDTPAATVRVPTPLRKHTNDAAELTVQGFTVREIFERLAADYAELKEKICDENGEVRRFVNVYVNSENIRQLDDLDSAIKDGDEISIIPAIAGG